MSQAVSPRSVLDKVLSILETGELATIRKQYFAVDNEEFARGTRSIAAGITHD